MPSVAKLTAKILGDLSWRYEGDTYGFCRRKEDHDSGCPVVAVVREVLRELFAFADTSLFAAQRSPANYEDVCALLAQLREEDIYGVWNPAVRDFCRSFTLTGTAALAKLQRDCNGDRTSSLQSTTSLWRISLQFISAVVRYEIDNDPSMVESRDGVDAFTVIADLAEAAERLDIISLNHDLLIEQEFKRRGIAFFDGFEVSRQLNGYGLYRGFQPDSSASVRLCKLHGSIDWREHHNQSGWDVLRPPDMVAPWPAEYKLRPFASEQMLMGTINKESQYLRGILGDLYCWARLTLRDYRTVFVSGYGFKDRGVDLTPKSWT